jgi:hypothetical protein
MNYYLSPLVIDKFIKEEYLKSILDGPLIDLTLQYLQEQERLVTYTSLDISTLASLCNSAIPATLLSVTPTSEIISLIKWLPTWGFIVVDSKGRAFIHGHGLISSKKFLFGANIFLFGVSPTYEVTKNWKIIESSNGDIITAATYSDSFRIYSAVAIRKAIAQGHEHVFPSSDPKNLELEIDLYFSKKNNSDNSSSTSSLSNSKRQKINIEDKTKIYEDHFGIIGRMSHDVLNASIKFIFDSSIPLADRIISISNNSHQITQVWSSCIIYRHTSWYLMCGHSSYYSLWRLPPEQFCFKSKVPLVIDSIGNFSYITTTTN